MRSTFDHAAFPIPWQRKFGHKARELEFMSMIPTTNTNLDELFSVLHMGKCMQHEGYFKCVQLMFCFWCALHMLIAQFDLGCVCFFNTCTSVFVMFMCVMLISKSMDYLWEINNCFYRNHVWGWPRQMQEKHMMNNFLVLSVLTNHTIAKLLKLNVLIVSLWMGNAVLIKCRRKETQKDENFKNWVLFATHLSIQS